MLEHRIGHLARALLLGALAVGAAVPAAAQEERTEEEPGRQEAARVDSLAARVARLEALVDSLLAELARRPAAAPAAAGEPPAEAAPAPEAAGEEAEEADELADLRAAAEEAAARGREARPDTGRAGESRTRNLQSLNPEISVTGDFLGLASDGPDEDARVTGVPREFEFSFQAALDPYTRTKIFVTRHEDFEIAGLEGVLGHGHGHEEEGEDPADEEPGAHQEEEAEEGHGFEIEEGYMYWVGLPGNLGLKAGKFRQEIGLYNRWHNHALFEVDRPLAPAAFLGPEGLAQTGVSVTLPSVQAGPATGTAWLEVTGASNPLFEGGTDLSYLGRAQGFFDLGPSSYLQAGATGLYGENDDLGLTSRLLGLDLSYNWSPAGRSLYEELSLKGEWYWAERDFPAETESGTGGYAQANYRLDRRWVLGLRGDWLDGFESGHSVFQLVPSVSWWQSEWVRLRLQYNYVKPEDEDPGHTLLFQTVWAVGPHKHETY